MRTTRQIAEVADSNYRRPTCGDSGGSTETRALQNAIYTSVDVADQPVRILIVDDEHHNRQLLEIMLEPDGFDLLTAASGEEALSMGVLQPPDLILLDVMMPGMDGHGRVSGGEHDQG